MDQYLELDKERLVETKREMSRVNQCVFYSTCVMVGCILFGLVVLGCTVGSDANVLISDGSRSITEIEETMRDVNEVIPNIRRLLDIIETLCESKKFTGFYGIDCGLEK